MQGIGLSLSQVIIDDDLIELVSEGQFELTFDVVGPVKVSQTQSYYGANDSQGNDKYPASAAFDDDTTTRTTGDAANPCSFVFCNDFSSNGLEINYDFGEATDYLNDKMGITFLADVTIRYSRVSLNGFWGFGLITEPKHNDATTNEDESFGVTLGFTVFDSRYIRVEPFIGGGLTNYSYVEDIPYDFILGNNLDFRFFATRPSRVGRGSFAFNLRFKYMMQNAGNI